MENNDQFYEQIGTALRIIAEAYLMDVAPQVTLEDSSLSVDNPEEPVLTIKISGELPEFEKQAMLIDFEEFNLVIEEI